MPLSDRLCGWYQSLFTPGHPEQASLRRLHAEGESKSDFDEFFRAYFDHEQQKGHGIVERFRALTTEWEGGRALDFGAGGGGLTFQIRHRTREAVGIDVQTEKLDFARKQIVRLGMDRIEFVDYDGELPAPLASGSFDCIFCVDVIEHLPTPERFIAEFRRLLRPGGTLLLSFGPPWRHAHGKHLWTQLPGWWTHLLFPRPTVMRALGQSSDTTYEALGLHRLTVGKYERIMRTSGFETLYQTTGIMKVLRPLGYLPIVREFFISEVVGVYRNPA